MGPFLLSIIAVSNISYQLVDLSPNEYLSSSSFAISQTGSVTVRSGGQAYIWQEGVFTALAGSPIESLYPHSINSSNAVAGWIQGPGHPGAGQWLLPGVFQSYGFGEDSRANGINDLGVAVGQRRVGAYTRAFRWESGLSIDLGTLGGNEAVAHAVNTAGLIVGSSTNASGRYRAFLYENGSMRDLGTTFGVDAVAQGINGHGDAVGNQNLRALLWLRSGQIVEIGGLAGYFDNRATGINNGGEVVGFSIDGQYRAWKWHNGVITDLNSLALSPGWLWQTAVGINERGWIAGSGLLAGRNRALLAVPATTSYCDLLTLYPGIRVSGTVANLQASDNSYFVAKRNLAADEVGCPITLEVFGTSPVQVPSVLQFHVESRVSVTGLTLSVALYDYAASTWLEFRSLPGPTSDTYTTVYVPTPSRFVHPSTGRMKARICLSETALDSVIEWQAFFDRVVWWVSE